MTVICAAFGPDGTFVGSDTQVSGTAKLDIRRKVRRWGDWLVGFAGAAAWTQFYTEFDSPEEFSAIWTAWAREEGHVGDGGAGDGHRRLQGEWLLVRGRRIAIVTNDGGVVRPTVPYCAIGSGDEVAIGALATARALKLPARQAVALAVKAAIKHAHGCGGRAVVEAVE